MSQAPELYCEFVEIERLKEFVEEGEYIEDKRCRENAFMRYCKALDNNLQDTKMWGGYVEIMAIAEQYERPGLVTFSSRKHFPCSLHCFVSPNSICIEA